MKLFGLIGVASYCVAALVIGVRLLWLARRTGELPERLIGIAFLSGGGLGYTGLVAASLLSPTAPDAAGVLFYAGWSGMSLAASCLLVFWRRVYHPSLSAARGVVVGGIVLVAVSMVGVFLTGAPGADLASNPWYLAGLVAQGGSYAVNAWASTRYCQLLRRRSTLGLAEPVVANRIQLWSVASWAITLQYSYSITRLTLTGQSSTSGPETMVISSLGLLAAGTMLLAFFPPPWYLRHIEGSAVPSPELR